jgi:hypothetical protein
MHTCSGLGTCPSPHAALRFIFFSVKCFCSARWLACIAQWRRSTREAWHTHPHEFLPPQDSPPVAVMAGTVDKEIVPLRYTSSQMQLWCSPRWFLGPAAHRQAPTHAPPPWTEMLLIFLCCAAREWLRCLTLKSQDGVSFGAVGGVGTPCLSVGADCWAHPRPPAQDGQLGADGQGYKFIAALYLLPEHLWSTGELQRRGRMPR